MNQSQRAMPQQFDPRISAFINPGSAIQNGSLHTTNDQFQHLCMMMANQLNAMKQMVEMMDNRFTMIDSKMDSQFGELRGLLTTISLVSLTPDLRPEPLNNSTSLSQHTSTSGGSVDDTVDRSANSSGSPPAPDDTSGQSAESRAQSQDVDNDEPSQSTPGTPYCADWVSTSPLAANGHEKKRPRKSTINSGYDKILEAIQYKRDNPNIPVAEVVRKFNIPDAYRLITSRFRNGKERPMQFRHLQKGPSPMLSEKEIHGLEAWIWSQIREGKEMDRSTINAYVTGIFAKKDPPKPPPSKSYMDHLMMKLKENMDNAIARGLENEQTPTS